MSATDYFLNKGFTPINKSVVLSGTGTATVWAPLSGYRVIVTALSVSSNPAGTIAFYFDGENSKIAGYNLAASSNISPEIGCWESTVSGGRIFAKLSASQTDGTQINLTGFEIPTSAI